MATSSQPKQVKKRVGQTAQRWLRRPLAEMVQGHDDDHRSVHHGIQEWLRRAETAEAPAETDGSRQCVDESGCPNVSAKSRSPSPTPTGSGMLDTPCGMLSSSSTTNQPLSTTGPSTTTSYPPPLVAATFRAAKDHTRLLQPLPEVAQAKDWLLKEVRLAEMTEVAWTQGRSVGALPDGWPPGHGPDAPAIASRGS